MSGSGRLVQANPPRGPTPKSCIRRHSSPLQSCVIDFWAALASVFNAVPIPCRVDRMSNTRGPSGERNSNSRGPDPDLWRVGEADHEIASLRDALDEHLRSLEAPPPPPHSRQYTPPSSGYSYHSAGSQISSRGSSESHRSGVVVFAAITGLFLGAVVSIFMVGFQRAKTPVVTSQNSPQASSSPVASPQPKQASPTPSRETAAPAESRGEAERTEGRSDVGSTADAPPASTANVRWQACLDQDRREAEPPQPGETWWPVVGPSNSLDDARRHCRADAFINRSGNAQISSFRDRDTAMAFAEQLTQDSSHPWRFWVGDPSVR